MVTTGPVFNIPGKFLFLLGLFDCIQQQQQQQKTPLANLSNKIKIEIK